MAKTHYTLFDSYSYWREPDIEKWYNEYVKEEQDMGCEPMSIEDWRIFEMESDWEMVKESIKLVQGDFGTVKICGTLCLWWGRPEIEPVVATDLLSAIERCCCDCDYVTIEVWKSKIEVRATHHDGTNCFTLRTKNKRKEMYLF